MGNQECEFNLLDEPWIKVMKENGTIEEVSLITVFEQAHLYTDLAGELATQNVAMLRLLLAVLHTVFSRVDEHGEEAPICLLYTSRCVYETDLPQRNCYHRCQESTGCSAMIWLL